MLLAAKKAAPAGQTLRTARRRLSVVSDNKLVEGLSALGIKDFDGAAGSQAPTNSYKRFYGVTKKGYAPYNPRKRNQDSLMMAEHKDTHSLLVGVFDGHGEAGDLVSRYFTDRLPAALYKNPLFASDPTQALVEELDKIEQLLLTDVSIDTEFSGSTGVVGVLRGTDLYVCNIGDSRVILGAKAEGAAAASSASSASLPPAPLTAVQVSRDHKPELPDETARIKAAGGRVFAVEYEVGEDGPHRVWLADVDIPGLAMSRSLGDTVAHTAGVTSEPETHHVRILPGHTFMVWGSDGLYEFLSNEEILAVIVAAEAAALAKGGSAPGEYLKVAAEKLIAESSARWLARETVIDDITVAIIELGGEHQAVAVGGAPRRASLIGGGALAAAAAAAGSSGGGGGVRRGSGTFDPSAFAALKK